LKTVHLTAEVRLCAVLWTFGFILVLLSMAAQGRVTTGWVALSVIPLLLLGVALSLGAAAAIRWAGRKGRTAAAATLVVTVVLAGFVMTTADHYLNMLLALTVIPSWRTWALTLEPSSGFMIAILYTWTLLLSLALIWAARTSDAARLNEARAAAFEAAASRAEAAYLRLQLNPHLVFNTLNGIASLVVRGKDVEAEEMIGRLADFMRISFASDPAAMIPLETEIETVRAYLRIEEARFGDRLKVDYVLDDAVRNVLVPNFLLQPLVENAVKHGLARSRGEVRIAVEGRADHGALRLSVVNRGGASASATSAPGGGLGLTNVRQRLESVYGQAAQFTTRSEEGAYTAEIALPLEAPPAPARAIA
jgi:signal transduction histidine kinase